MDLSKIQAPRDDEPRFRCDECGAEHLVRSDMGKFHDGPCGVCIACLRRLGEYGGGKVARGTNRPPAKKRRRKVRR